jgi:soluble lytic murein transglycosylase-like protein
MAVFIFKDMNPYIWAAATFLAVLFSFPYSVRADISRSVAGDGTVDYTGREAAPGGPRGLARDYPYRGLVERICADEGVDARLVACVIKVESNFDAGAVSVAGAMGLMQIMPDIARAYGLKDPFDPGENVRAGVRHLKALLSGLNGDVTLALAAYHAGLGRVRRRNAVPPIKSTVAYVSDVMRLYSGRAPSGIEPKVRRLYKKVRDDGTIEIFDR